MLIPTAVLFYFFNITLKIDFSYSTSHCQSYKHTLVVSKIPNYILICCQKVVFLQRRPPTNFLCPRPSMASLNVARSLAFFPAVCFWSLRMSIPCYPLAITCKFPCYIPCTFVFIARIRFSVLLISFGKYSLIAFFVCNVALDYFWLGLGLSF